MVNYLRFLRDKFATVAGIDKFGCVLNLAASVEEVKSVTVSHAPKPN